MLKDRDVLSKILKSWAQEHDPTLQINSPKIGDDGVEETSEYLTWTLKNTDVHIDLVNLLDRLEFYVDNIHRKRHPDGMFCRHCQAFYQYAESNQPDGTLLCYACRSNPYI